MPGAVVSHPVSGPEVNAVPLNGPEATIDVHFAWRKNEPSTAILAFVGLDTQGSRPLRLTIAGRNCAKSSYALNGRPSMLDSGMREHQPVLNLGGDGSALSACAACVLRREVEEGTWEPRSRRLSVRGNRNDCISARIVY
jgi:hypothetical protein